MLSKSRLSAASTSISPRSGTRISEVQKEEGFARETDRYWSLESAIDRLIEECGFVSPIMIPPCSQGPLMKTEAIKEEFKIRVCEQIDLEPEGEGRFLVSTPFSFDDGDHFTIVLRREGEGWILSDEASTLMHLSYWLDDKAIESGNRKEIVTVPLLVSRSRTERRICYSRFRRAIW